MNANVELPEAFIDAVAEQVAELLANRDRSSPWLTRPEAAAHLRLPVSRLEKDKVIPSHKDRGRVLYHRDELDDYMRGC